MAEDKPISELMKEFVEQFMLYLRQQGKQAVTAIVVEPLTKAGLKLALALTAAALLVVGAVYLGNFMVLGLTWLFGGNIIWGYLASAILVVVIAVIVLMAMARVGKEETKDGSASGDGASGHGPGPAR